MGYRVKLSEKVSDDLKKLSAESAALILSWLYKNLEGTYNPRMFGYAIEKYKLDCWKYTMGIFDFYAKITQTEIIILSVNTRENRSI